MDRKRVRGKILLRICNTKVKYTPKSNVQVSEQIKKTVYEYEWERESEVAQSCPTLCDPMDCSLPGFSVHGIFQEWVLEWVVISFSRGSSWPRDRTQVSRIVGRRFTLWARMGRIMIIRVFPLSTGKFYCKSNQNINGIFSPWKITS